MSMLAKTRQGAIHAKDCFCCNDGFWKINKRNRHRIRKQNRTIENREFNRSLNKGDM